MRTRQVQAALVAVVAGAGFAHAASITDAEAMFLDPPLAGSMLDAGLNTLATIDVSNISTDEVQGFSGAVWEVTFDPSLTTVVGIGWDLNIQTTDAGVLSDLQIAFMIEDEFGDIVDGVVVQPSDLNFSADMAPFNETAADDGFALRSSMPPVVDLETLGLTFSTGDRILVELYTEFPGEAIRLSQGSELYIEVIPAPASAALLGLGGLVAARRRR